MTLLKDSDAVVARMIELLRLGACDDWAIALERIRMNSGKNSSEKASRLLAMYGGMGSLNDIVLYKNAQPLVEENNEFDMLRSQLYEICKK
ncbi:DUF6966 domain-containing protein [Pseudomonas syringae]|uniref:DUF6966 domain-containing protein n=1 Tax=Pseudomonas syringae TaxID=317 RepID=UPI00126930F7|nr:hypothetical protein [Pseudomonas syringae]